MSTGPTITGLLKTLQRTTPRFSRRGLLALGAGCAAELLAPAAQAQAWPGKPIHIAIPAPPGGPTDVLARLISDKLSPRLGQPVVVDNRPGASGILGIDAVAKAAPDGYTFLIALSVQILGNQFMFEKLPYNVDRDFVLVSQLVAISGGIVVVHPSVTATTGPQLLQYVASRKGTLSYGSYGMGTFPHLIFSHMSQTQNADMVHALYKGEAPMVQDLIGGQFQMSVVSALLAKPHIESGKLKAIGVAGANRNSAVPNLATLSEQGLTDEAYSLGGFFGMAAPANTPKEIVQRMAREVKSVCDMPEVSGRLESLGWKVTAGTPEEFVASWKKAYPVWEKLIRQSGVKAE